MEIVALLLPKVPLLSTGIANVDEAQKHTLDGLILQYSEFVEQTNKDVAGIMISGVDVHPSFIDALFKCVAYSETGCKKCVVPPVSSRNRCTITCTKTKQRCNRWKIKNKLWCNEHKQDTVTREFDIGDSKYFAQDAYLTGKYAVFGADFLTSPGFLGLLGKYQDKGYVTVVVAGTRETKQVKQFLSGVPSVIISTDNLQLDSLSGLTNIREIFVSSNRTELTELAQKMGIKIVLPKEFKL
jgi:hypothetical protein